MRTIPICILSIVCELAGGCGYSLAGRGSFLPDYIKTILCSFPEAAIYTVDDKGEVFENANWGDLISARFQAIAF